MLLGKRTREEPNSTLVAGQKGTCFVLTFEAIARELESLGIPNAYATCCIFVEWCFGVSALEVLIFPV